METNRDKIIITLAKIKAKVDSARQIGNMEEAKVLLDTLNRLLAKHKLEMSDLEFADYLKEEIVTEAIDWSEFDVPHTRKRCTWQMVLAQIVSSSTNCRILCGPNSNRLIFVGRKEDVQLTVKLVGMISKIIHEESELAYRKRYYECSRFGASHAAKNYRKYYIIGFLSGVNEQYIRMKQEIVVMSTSTSLMRIDQPIEAVNEFLEDKLGSEAKDNMHKPTIKYSKQHNIDGYHDGRIKGLAVNLNPNREALPA